MPRLNGAIDCYCLTYRATCAKNCSWFIKPVIVRMSIFAFSGAFCAFCNAFHSGVSYRFIMFSPWFVETVSSISNVSTIANIILIYLVLLCFNFLNRSCFYIGNGWGYGWGYRLLVPPSHLLNQSLY